MPAFILTLCLAHRLRVGKQSVTRPTDHREYRQADKRDVTDNNNQPKQEPRMLSPTPLCSWVNQHSPIQRAAFVVLLATFIACGGKAALTLPLTPIPATQQLLFVLLAGGLLGSRRGALAALVYLVMASLYRELWPDAAGPTPLRGPMAGHLWSLPLAAYLSGYFVERERKENLASFAMGACAGIAAHDACATLWLIHTLHLEPVEAYMKGVGVFLGLQVAQGTLAVLIASSASLTVRSLRRK